MMEIRCKISAYDEQPSLVQSLELNGEIAGG